MCKAYCRAFIGRTKGRERGGTNLGKQNEMEIKGRKVNKSLHPALHHHSLACIPISLCSHYIGVLTTSWVFYSNYMYVNTSQLQDGLANKCLRGERDKNCGGS